MKISFAAPRMPRSGTVVVAIMDDRKMSPHAAEIDKQSDGAIARAMQNSRFSGKADEILMIPAPANMGDVARVMLFGVGKPRPGDRTARQNRGGVILAAAQRRRRDECRVLRQRLQGQGQRRWPPPISLTARGCAPIASTNTAPRRSPSRSRR